MKFTRIPIALVAILLFAVACKQPPTPPQPALTGALGGGMASDIGWIDPSDVGRTNLSDLPPMRSRGFDTAGGDAVVENALSSIYFDFDQSAVRPGDRAILQEASDYLAQHPDTRLLIEGHCDWRGTSEYNMALGERRAASALDYIVSLGVSADRIEIVSKGDLEASQSESEAQLQEDRRADLIVLR